MLRMRDVTKKIRQKYVLEEFHMHVEEGSLYALIGAAGSGKTSVLRICTGLMEADCGSVVINGFDMGEKENQKRRSRLIGYMDEKNGIYPNLMALEYLEFYAHAHGMYGLSARERCLELLRMANMERRAGILMENLPDSALRQMEFLRTMLHNPALLLLDNPFEGMDLHERLLTQNLMTQLCSEGTTIVFTTSSVAEILNFCQYVGLMREGKMVAEGKKEIVMEQIRQSAPLYMEIANGQAFALALLHANQRVQSFTYDNHYFMIHFIGNSKEEAQLLRQLIESGVEVSSFHRGEEHLEDLNIFL